MNRPWVLTFLILVLCVGVFYAPILLSAGTVVTTSQEDPVAHLLFSLGDARVGGRFFHYFDLSANTRLWAQDVKFHPLHLIRLISIGLGSSLVGWGVLVIGVHVLLFLAVVYYSRRIFRIPMPAAHAGGAVAFFSLAWAEWVALVYWTAGTVLGAVSLGEYWLFLSTGRRRHLLICAMANALQPYVTHTQALIPTQAYLFGAVLLIASYRRTGWRQILSPWVAIVWPLTVLGWVPIMAPVLFSIASGLALRDSVHPLAWGVDGSVLTGFLGLVCPSPPVLADLFAKLGWIQWAAPPYSTLFGSFLLLPALVSLWQSGQRRFRVVAAGMVLYLFSLLVSEFITVPSATIRGLGFYRSFFFPLLSGFVVAAGLAQTGVGRSEDTPLRILHWFYGAIGIGVALMLIPLFAISPEVLSHQVSRLGLLGSGTRLHHFLFGTRAFAAGIALGILGYAAYRRAGGICQLAGLCAAIAAPTLGFAYAQEWHRRPAELNAVLSCPSEFQFLRGRIPRYEHRVGVVLASDLRLAQGDSAGFWATVAEPRNDVLSHLRSNDIRLRQGLAFTLPALHFLAPIHSQLRREGNPFLAEREGAAATLLRRRNVIVRPEAEIFEEYGVRYWLSNFDLERLHSGKFRRVYLGEYGDVFENHSAKPVAFFLGRPMAPLPLRHLQDGILLGPLDSRGGRVSIHVDLRGMRARAIGPEGRGIPLAPEPAGMRWLVDVPPGSSAVEFTAAEYRPLMMLAAASAAAFLLLAAATARLPCR